MHDGRRLLFVIAVITALPALVLCLMIPAAGQVGGATPAPAETRGPSGSDATPAPADSPAVPATPSPEISPSPPPEQAGAAVALVMRYFEALKRLDFKGAIECLEGYGAPDKKAEALQDFMRLYPSRSRLDLMECEENVGRLASEVDKYAYTHDGKVPKALKEVLSKELYQIPLCPSAGADTYSAGFKSSMRPHAYTLLCSGDHHKDASVGRDTPSYSTAKGLVSRRTWHFPQDCRWRLDSWQIMSVLRAGGMFQVKVRERGLIFEDSPSTVEGDYYVARLDKGYRILLIPTLGNLEPEKKDLESYLKLLHFSRGIVFFCNWMENPDFWKDRAERRLVGCVNNLKSLGDAVESYALDHGGAIPRTLKALIPNYIRFLPLCPAADANTYLAGYRLDRKTGRYLIMCRGHHHGGSGSRANYPRLDSSRGVLLQ
jgi:hypothetical protein